MNELKTLLNTLIARGGKPFNLNGVTKCEIADHGIYFYEGERSVEFCSYRELVSLESGLWQFVCSHLLIGPNKSDWMKNADIGSDGYITSNEYYTALNHQYRLLESALVPEEELGKFLVDNIIVEGLKSEQSKK